jgi:hypothetical protein
VKHQIDTEKAACGFSLPMSQVNFFNAKNVLNILKGRYFPRFESYPLAGISQLEITINLAE